MIITKSNSFILSAITGFIAATFSCISLSSEINSQNVGKDFYIEQPNLKNPIVKKKNYTININEDELNNKFFNDIIEEFWMYKGREIFSLVENVKINGFLQNGERNNSHSNAEKNNCELNLYFKPLNEKTINEDNYFKMVKFGLLFSLTHELSHCILGKDVFNGTINWESSLKSDDVIFLNNKVKTVSDNVVLKNYLEKGDRLKNPIITYHETFADAFALLYLAKYDVYKEPHFDRLFKERKRNCEENYLQCSYTIYFYNKELMKVIRNENLKRLNMYDMYRTSNQLALKSLINDLIKGG